jgi:hypothetical protein
MVDDGEVYTVLVGKPEGKRKLRRLRRRRYEDGIRKGLRETGCRCVG